LLKIQTDALAMTSWKYYIVRKHYLKDSCPGVSIISMPGIFMFSLSN